MSLMVERLKGFKPVAIYALLPALVSALAPIVYSEYSKSTYKLEHSISLSPSVVADSKTYSIVTILLKNSGTAPLRNLKLSTSIPNSEVLNSNSSSTNVTLNQNSKFFGSTLDTLFPADDVGVSILVAGHSELFPRVELISTEVKSEISSFPERPSSKTISSVRIFSLGALVYLSALLAYFLFVRRRKKGSGIPVLENSLLYLAGAAGIPRLQDKIWNQRFSNIAYFGAADIILAEAVAKGPKFKKHYIAAIESLILAGAPQGEVQLILGCIRRLDQNYDSNRLFELSELGKTALTLSEKRTLISKHLG